MNNIRLNHFRLWCKNWYQPIDSGMDIITEARKILTLDGYLSCNNPIAISLNYIDDLVKDGIIQPIRLLVWNEEIVRYMSVYDFNYNEALLYRIRNFFAFECYKLPLNPPIYSRKIYKLGFVAPTNFGNSYKLANYKTNKFFNKK
jgi:hypothetical protein